MFYDASAGQTVAGGMAKDPVKTGLHVGVYIVLFILGTIAMSWVLLNAGYLVGIVLTEALAAVFANWLAMRIFEGRSLVDVGLWWHRASSENLAMGAAGGVGAALAVLVPAVAAGAAHFRWTPDDQPSMGAKVLVTVLLAAGVIGEELLFRGYGFQLLLATVGPWAAIVMAGALFGILHWQNPNAGWFGLANTAGFGVLFGYAWFRSRDLWLPIGLHFGWNFTVPLFGVNLSGLRMKITGYELSWTAGKLWSGGEYGPEASVLTSAVLIALFCYVWRIPVRRQVSPFVPPAESAVCEPSPSLPS